MLLNKSHWRMLLLTILTLSLQCATEAAHGDDSKAIQLYRTRIKPILQSRCFACHGALKQESSLRVDTVDFMKRGGDSGSAISDGKQALLLERVTADEHSRMPPEGAALTSEQIAAIREWLAAGAAGPADEAPEAAPDEHWAFQAARRSELPTDVHPIDELLRRQRGDRPVTVIAEKRQLVRRLYIDLIGIPPSLEQQAAFLEDDRDDAYERLVNELLESPHHGERWGRHWMDIWRYSDWYGLGAQLRNSQKHLWHWRDWIIESLNEDRGYDEMVQLMLAADELRPEDMDSIRATGFLARQYYLFNRTTWLDSTLEHTAKAFLGLTVNCAKCHDHKYDPLSQREYYQLRAIFEPYQVRLDPIAGETDLEKNGIPRVFDAHPDAPTFIHIRGDEKQPDKDTPITASTPAILGGPWAPVEVTLPITAQRPELRSYVRADRMRQAEGKISAAQTALQALDTQLNRVAAQPGVDPRSGASVVVDDFDALDRKRWEVEGKWMEGDHVVRQTAVGAQRRSLTLKQEIPADFVASLTFKVTAGEQWKSVGIAFDKRGDNEKMIYMSAYSGGSKLQVSYRTPAQTFPTDGQVSRSVKLNTTYTLTIAAQGPLLNVWIDDKFALAYRLPVSREAGALSLIAFDAAVEFDSFRLQQLPEGAALTASGAPNSPDDVKRKHELAAASLELAKAEHSALESAYAAAALEFNNDLKASASTEERGELAQELKRKAATESRRHRLAKAKHALVQAQHARATEGKDAKREDLDAKLKAAQAAVSAANSELAAPGEDYLLSPAGLKALEGPAESDAERRAAFPKTSTGRRAAFAKWLTDEQNPLTARVAVNHIWMRHFGDPLVESVTDFGRRAEKPVQAALLDHLAVELMQHQWSMKHLHRLIVTSQAYQLASHADEAVLEADPANAYLTRRRPLRIESDVIRDALLTLAGKLNPTLGGPTVAPAKSVTFRRSLYFTHSRDAVHSFLTMFDHADILRCYRRQESIVPQQALAMANSELSLKMSQAVAEALHESHVERRDFIEAAFQLVLCIDPSDAEISASEEMLRKTTALLKLRNNSDPTLRARHNFVHALFNHNDFVTLR